MLLLLDQFWPWLLIGGILLLAGIASANLSLKEWLGFIVSLPFTLIPDSTKTEKAQLDSQSAEEVVTANPGCILILTGVALITFGIFRWIL